MIPDYKCNAVYFSEWLKKDYPDIFIGVARILNKHNIAYDVILKIYGAETICHCSLIKRDICAMNTSLTI